MKIFQLETLYKIFDKIPENFSIKLRIQILKNKSIIESEYSLVEDLKKNLYTKKYIEYTEKIKTLETEYKEHKIDNDKLLSDISLLESEYSLDIKTQKERLEDYKEYVAQEYSGELIFINIDELPDDINELDAEFLEGLFLITT